MLGELYTDITRNHFSVDILEKIPLLKSRCKGVKRLCSRDTKTIPRNKIIEFPLIGTIFAIGGAVVKTPKD